MVNEPLIRPYFWGRGTLGWLISHEESWAGLLREKYILTDLAEDFSIVFPSDRV